MRLYMHHYSKGFGIPILEALQCDVPAIVSNTSSMPEVAGSAALLVDPTDPQDIADKMHLLYKDETLRNKLIANAGIQVKKVLIGTALQKDCGKV